MTPPSRSQRMGGKKSTRKPVKKAPRPKLEKTFACPFCSHEGSIECKLDRTRLTGMATCRICSASFQTVINCKDSRPHFQKGPPYLSEPIDVYSEWLDILAEQEGHKGSN